VTQSREELLPCPFCGVSDCLTMPSHAARKWVQCNNIHCQAEGPVADTPELAIESWNTRAIARDSATLSGEE
jgi:Lar family restriction alleviation protein